MNDYIEVLEVTGVNDQQLVTGIYPNPVRRKLNIAFGSTVELSEITVINSSGQEVYKTLYSGNRAQLDVRDLATGHYIVRVIDSNNPQSVVTYSFIKEN
ncbi:MAG: T9SS type A sorting domain-containing protein [Chitinophagales bacterium]